MALLDWDDYECMLESNNPPPSEPVWTEVTLRVLAPPAVLFLEAFTGGYEIAMIRSGQLGRPVACECGKVAVRFGVLATGLIVGEREPFYPKGYARYGTLPAGGPRAMRKQGQYCPHCDGAEDSP